MTESTHANHLSRLQRTLVTPLLRMLRRGASPRRLAWSLAVGIAIGINPVLGSATVIALGVAHLLKLNHTAMQIGVQGAYPGQLLLLLPFLRGGAWLFRSAPMRMQRTEMIAMIRNNPVAIARSLWTWEWHALIVWAVGAAALTPLLAAVLRRLLERTMTQHVHQDAS